ncbi:MAG: ATP-dependent DNA helicase RecG [Chelatococcus sp.]|nr:MAG: ATP-dependent DNA helicase RecG [Chelatococcus sp.]
MRPSLLDPLFASATTLSGVGPKLGKLLDGFLGDETHGARVVDLLFHLPTGAIDRRPSPTIADAPIGGVATFAARVSEHRPAPPGKGKAPYRIVVEDESGDVTLVFFHADVRHLLQTLPVGEVRIISGKLELWDGMRQMVHPDRILDPKLAATLPSTEPVYGLTEGIGPRVMTRIAAAAVEKCPELPEWQDAAFRDRNSFPAFAEAIRALHHPPDVKAVEGDTVARRRLGYDELLASQIALALVRRQQKKAAGRATAGDGSLRRRIAAALPFSLTEGQRQALVDIHADMEKPERMLRLLQGDVGSGKTVVALMAMAAAAEARRQSVLMAPTEILARQHAERLAPLAEQAGLKLALLTGREKGPGRRQVLEGLANGEIDIAVGTHALFQEGVIFRDLALAVVDEQHRFGVHQRLLLGSKGEAVDVLVMTATPIPRTLSLTWFGDMDISILAEKPAGRKPIATKAISSERYDEVVGAIRRAVEAGAQVYWVCPLVQESETLEVAAAQERFEALQGIFGSKVGLLHGQMPGRDKDAAMAAFSGGETRILVSTTVIEVGVDVPNASVMVIEHAERFGLAQLHQLRGRIGRGSAASTCLLLYKGPLGPVAEARLTIMRETEDGFRIAEEDLRLRGEGEVLGTKQSGSPDWRIARPEVDGDLLATARDDARLVIETDPHLESERGKAIRVLLYLFERDVAIRLLRAG